MKESMSLPDYIEKTGKSKDWWDSVKEEKAKIYKTN
jgi:hypothetical protein